MLDNNLKVGDKVKPKFSPNNSPIATIIEIIGNKDWFGETEFLVKLEFELQGKLLIRDFPQCNLILADETK
jgi:hypothetical protein